MQEFCLMSDHQYAFSENDLFLALVFFPGLEKLAFGHIMPSEGNWCGLLVNIRR
jgi:hypothetical protein